MGSCCTSNLNMLGEDFIRELISNESLKLRKLNYMDLLNEIVSKRVDQAIPKTHIKEYLIPELYDEEKAGNYDIYFQSIIEHILSQLEENSNMYIVLFYFYPFINHDKEKTYENFFSCLRYMTKSGRYEIDRSEVQKWLTIYVTFCTKDLTNAVYSKCPPNDELSNLLIALINKPFGQSNIDKFVGKLMEILTEGGPVELITSNMFKKLMTVYDISTIENVRDFLIKKEGF